jgi:hypothetical protein
LKRTVVLEGKVANDMGLEHFPFDADELEVSFWSASTFLTLDGSAGSPRPTGRTYVMRKVQEGGGEGEFFALGYKQGRLPDWETVGFSFKLNVAPASTSGQLCDEFTLRIHVLRKSSFYMWKTVMPIWLLWCYSMMTFAYQPEDLGGRVSLGSTMLLATFAMLYVTGSHLPKTDFLTSIDRVTNAALAEQFFSGFCAVVFYRLDYHEVASTQVLMGASTLTAVALIVIFVALNLYWLFPGWRRQRKLRRLALATESTVLDDGFDYKAISSLAKWRDIDTTNGKHSGLDCLLHRAANAASQANNKTAPA